MIPISANTARTDKATLDPNLLNSCVKCGLCLPHCPTYQINPVEEQSPRGRISIMQALVALDADPGDAAASHLQQCLSCRQCESVCPAKVPYGQLMEAARAELVQRGRKPKLAERVVTHFIRLGWFQKLTTAVIRTVLRPPVKRLLATIAPRRLQRLLRMLPDTALRPQLSQHTAAAGTRRGRVALFTGCVNPVLEPQVLEQSIALLSQAGFDVEVPAEQGCCGAIALHSGQSSLARQQMQTNAAVFDAAAADFVVFTATGCGATLKEYDRLVGADRIARTAHDVSWVLQQYPPVFVDTGQRETVALHQPCTQANGVGEHAASQALLKLVPQLHIVTLEDAPACCGAAGAHVLNHPKLANELLDLQIAAIRATGATRIVTANVGCAMHLRAGLHEAGLDIQVDHPVSVLTEFLQVTKY